MNLFKPGGRDSIEKPCLRTEGKKINLPSSAAESTRGFTEFAYTERHMQKINLMLICRTFPVASGHNFNSEYTVNCPLNLK